MKLATLLLAFVCLPLSFVVSAQVCKPAITVFFESDADSLTDSEFNRLDSLVQEMKLDTTINYRMEIYAYTDTTASEQYNNALSERRGEGISNYLQENYPNEFESIQIFPKGEQKGVSGLTEELAMRSSRRSEVILFEMKNGRMLLEGKRGTQMEINPDYFNNCPICREDGTKINTIKTNEEAEENGISMTTNGGSELFTGGMMKFDFECDRANDCFPVTIRIPSGDLDTTMSLWVSSPDSANGAWIRGGSTLKFEDGYYVMEIECFNSDSIYNVDKEWTGPSGRQIIVPFSIYPGLVVRNKFQAKMDYRGSYPDTIAFVSYFLNLPPDNIQHEGIDAGIKFETDVKLEQRHWIDKAQKIRVPLSDYTAIVIHSDNNIQIRMPWNSNRELKLFIPIIDSLYDEKIGYLSSEQRDYAFKNIEAEYQIYACDKNTGKCGLIPAEGIRVRKNKGKKTQHIKVKRSAIRNLE